MADEVPGPQEFEGPHFPHGWHPYEDYLNVHLSHMRSLLDEGLVLNDELSFVEVEDDGRLIQVNITGRVECTQRVIVQVDKWLKVQPDLSHRPLVRSYLYTYHAWLEFEGADPRWLIRYDNSLVEALHRHTYDPHTGEELAKFPIDLNELPNLDQFIRMAIDLGRMGQEL